MPAKKKPAPAHSTSAHFMFTGMTLPDWEIMEERAAILEYDAGLPRRDAEAEAYRMLKGSYPAGYEPKQKEKV